MPHDLRAPVPLLCCVAAAWHVSQEADGLMHVQLASMPEAGRGGRQERELGLVCSQTKLTRGGQGGKPTGRVMVAAWRGACCDWPLVPVALLYAEDSRRLCVCLTQGLHNEFDADAC